MNTMTRTLSQSALAAMFGGALLFWSGELPTTEGASIVSKAEALVGAPATPRSAAGVARRTTRRAVVGTGAVAVGTARAVTVGAATAGAVATTRAVTVGAATAGAVAAGAAAPVARGCARVIGPLGRSALVCR